MVAGKTSILERMGELVLSGRCQARKEEASVGRQKVVLERGGRCWQRNVDLGTTDQPCFSDASTSGSLYFYANRPHVNKTIEKIPPRLQQKYIRTKDFTFPFEVRSNFFRY